MIHLEGMTGSYDVITTDERLALAYAAELLSAAGHPQAASIKSRKSRTANETYLSNGCIRCDALFGQFFISEDLADVVVKGAVNSLPILVNVTRPAIEWYVLAASRHPAEAARSGCPRAPSGGTSMPGPPIGTPNEWHTSRSACPQRIPVHTTGGRTYQHTKREVLIGDPLPARLRRSRIRK
jgi:hypothetical protein